MAGREKPRPSIVTDEALSVSLGSISDRLDSLEARPIATNIAGSITTPTPKIPFKVVERATPEGIFITVSGSCSANTQSIKVLLIRQARNQQIKVSGVLETVAQAVLRIERESRHLTFELAVEENQAAVQIFEGEIGPLEPKKNPLDNKFQLLRLIAFDEKASFAKNPAKSPFTAVTTITAPSTGPGAALGTGAGALSAGIYTYRVTYLTINAETDGSPASNTVTVTAPGTNGMINLTSIPTGPPASVRARNIYRTAANGSTYKLVAQLSNNTVTTFTDNVADAALMNPLPTVNGTGGLPVPSLIVDNDNPMTTDDERFFFTVGNSVADLPNAPSLADIVCNRVNIETPAADAALTFRLKTATGMTFADAGVQSVKAVFKRVGDTVIPGTPTENQDAPIEITGTIVDSTVSEILLQRNFPLGIQFQWVRNVFVNASGQEKAVGTSITFFAGGTQNLTNLVQAYLSQPGSSADGRLKVVVTLESPNSSTVTAFFTQPTPGSDPCVAAAQAALFRRIRFLKQKASGAWVEKDHFLAFTDETLFVGGEQSVSREIPHKPNQTGINFRVELVGVGAIPAPKITADSNGNSTTLAAFPIDPISSDVTTAPDGDTEAEDAYVDVIIWTSLAARNLDPAAMTFRQIGIEQVFFLIKRLKSDATASDIDDPDTRYTHYTAPVPTEDMDSTKTIVRQRGLRLSRKYRIRRTGFIGDNSVVQSAGATPVNFTAGQGTLDITGIVTYPPTVNKQDKGFSQVICQFDQPAAGAPVALKNIALLRHRPNDATIVFSGSLNDMTVGGTWSVVDAHVYVVTIVSTASPNRFSATRDGVAVATSVAITAGANTAIGSDGVTIKFNAQTGHSNGSTWTFTAVFREIDRKVLRSQNEYSDNTSGSPPITDATLKYRKFVDFDVKHKANAVGIQYAYEIRAVGNAFKDSAVSNQGNTGNDAPNFPGQIVPAIPRDGFTTDVSPGDFVVNASNGDSAMPGVDLTIRVHASEARATTGLGGTGTGGAINFNDVGADTAEINISLSSDATGAKKLTFGGLIADPTQIFVDISCPGLTFGELYMIRRYLVSNAGAEVGQAGSVWFRAGGSIDLTGVLVTIVSVTIQDVHSSVIQVKVQQPSTKVVLFKNLQIARAQGSPLGAQVEVASSRVILRDDTELYAAVNTSKIFDMIVNHKKNTNIQYQATLLGLKGATGGTGGSDRIIVASAVGNTGDEATFSDTAKPAYAAGRTPRLKFRWHPTIIKLKFIPPTLNMNTHSGNFVALKIQIVDPVAGTSVYTFNASDNTLFSNSFFLSFDQNNPNDDYYQAIDKNSLAAFAFNRPDQTTALPAGNGDLDPGIVSLIRTAVTRGGFANLTCEIYVQNMFAGTPDYLLIVSNIIRWDNSSQTFLGLVAEASFG